MVHLVLNLCFTTDDTEKNTTQSALFFYPFLCALCEKNFVAFVVKKL